MSPRKKWSLAGIFVGLALLPGFLCGVLGTLFGMTQSFDAIASSGSPSPEALADGVYLATVWTAAGIGASVLGLILLVVSLIAFFTAPQRAAGRAPSRSGDGIAQT